MSTSPTVPNIGIGPAERTNPSIARFRRLKQEIFQGLRVAMPGVIQSFDASKQTCTVLPAITDNIRIQGQLTTVPIPILADVPIVMMRAGGFSITTPVTVGDECVLLFLDSCMDSWWQSGCEAGNGYAPQNQLDNRRHDLSDPVALVGIWNQTNVLEEYPTESIQIRSDDGEIYIDVSASGIQIVGPTVSVNTTGTAIVSAKTVQVSAQDNATVTAENVIITGSSGVSINGTDWQSHFHSGVASGGSTTGPVAG